MWDFPENENLKYLLNDFIEQGKLIGLVGHAVAVIFARILLMNCFGMKRSFVRSPI
jgi:cell division protein FtsX